MCTSRSSRLVRTVGAVAVVVVDAEGGYADSWVANACEGLGVLVVFCDYCELVSGKARLLRVLLSQSRSRHWVARTFRADTTRPAAVRCCKSYGSSFQAQKCRYALHLLEVYPETGMWERAWKDGVVRLIRSHVKASFQIRGQHGEGGSDQEDPLWIQLR